MHSGLNLALVANKKDDTISLLTLPDGTPVATLAVGRDPYDVAVHAGRKEALVTLKKDDALAIIDLAGQAVAATLAVGREPRGVSVDPGTQRAAVANKKDDTVSLIDLAARSVIATLPAGKEPLDVAFDPVSHEVLVVLEEGDRLQRLDPATGAVVASVPVGAKPRAIAVHVGLRLAAVISKKDDSVSLVDLATDSVVATLAVGQDPNDVAVDEAGRKALVVNHHDDTVTVVDLVSRTVTATLPVGKHPYDAAFTADGALAVVSNEEDGNVTLLGFTPADSDPPVIEAMVTPAANGAGWHNSDVTVSYTCSDASSGVATCPPAVTVTTEGVGQQVSATAADNAGNSATATVTLNIDKTPPGILPPLDLVVEATALSTPVDLGSAVANDALAGSLPVTADQSGPFPLGTHLVTWRATDPAGNSASAVQTVVVQDTTPPVVTPPPPDVAVTANSVPATVTLGSASATDIFGPVTVSNDAPVAFPEGNTTITWTATDANGNSATATQGVSITLDTVPPVITLASAGLTNQAAYTLRGSLDEEATLTIDGQAVAVAADLGFSHAVTLLEGANTFSLRAVDIAGNETLLDFTVVLDSTPPVVTPPPDLTVEATAVLTPVNLGAASASDGRYGALSVTPDRTGPFTLGTHTITWRATDSAGNSASAVQTVVVRDTTPPVVTAPPDVAVTVNSVPATVALGSASATDIFGPVTVSNDAPVAFPEGNTTITWTATDANGNSATASQSVTVTLNTAPTIVSIPVTGATAGSLYAYDVNATDPDPADSLTYNLMLAPPGMAIDAATGLIQWTPADNQAGDHNITVVVTDTGGLSASQSFVVSVVPRSLAPSIVSTPPTTAQPGLPYSYAVQASDPDNDPLSYALTTAPAGMTIDAVTGVINWTPVLGDVGDHPVSVLVSDGTDGADTQGYTLTVTTPANAPPRMITTPPIVATAGQAYVYDADAADPDTYDRLEFSLLQAPAGMTIDPMTGVVRWTPAVTAAGDFPVTIQVRDAAGAGDSQSFIVTVTTVALPPRITSVPPLNARAGGAYTYAIQAEDPNAGDTLTYTLVRGPAAMTLDAATGVLNWTADARYGAPPAVAGGACMVDAPDSAARRPVTKWLVDNAAIGPPVVGPLVDTNGDGRSDRNDAPMVGVLVGGDTNTRLAVVRGNDGSLVWRNDAVALYVTAIGFADVDGDGLAELFAYARDGRIVAFNGQDGSVKWTTGVLWTTPSGDDPANNKASAFSFADLDGDGLAEILFGGVVLNHDGTLRWRQATAVSSLAVDLDLDGVYEVILGDEVYDRNGNFLYDFGGNLVPYSARSLTIAGLDADPYPEVIYHEGFVTYVFEHDGIPKWQYNHNSWVSQAPPVVADLDGDGLPEIAAQARDRIDILGADGVLKAARTVNYFDSSAFTGTTAFDFMGVGSYELINNDHSRLYILDGGTALAQYEWSHGSYTQHEYAVVADIDQDGHAELVVYGGGNGRWVAYEDRDDQWPAAPAIWNQYHYYPGVIDADGHVSTTPVAAWGYEALFRANPALSTPAAPDLQIAAVDFQQTGGGLRVQAVIVNNGDAAISSPLTVNLYDGPDPVTATLLGSTPLDTLAAGERRAFLIRSSADISAATELLLVVDPDDTVRECAEDNNRRLLPLVEVQVRDDTGLADSQLFALGVVRISSPPSITSTPPTAVAAGENYRYALTVSDPDPAERFSYRLVTAPPFMDIDDQGVINALAQGGAAQEGDYNVTVEVCDLAGACVRQSYVLTVGPTVANQPPFFVEQPPNLVNLAIGELFVYRIQAGDPDGASPFVDVDLRPKGLLFDPVEKVVQWTPGVGDIGDNLMGITLYDDRGAIASYQMTLRVYDPVLQNNHNPSVVSTAPGLAYVGRLYDYPVIAVDADGDVLSYSLVSGPAGMVMNGSTLQWTPDATQVGGHTITFRVTDEHGAYAGASYGITVSDVPPTNNPPVILSAPPPVAVVGQLYTYTLSATDPDGDSLIFSGPNLAAGMNFDPATATLSWVPGAAQVGTQYFAVKVDDGRGGSTSQSVSVSVVPDNQPPTITSTPPRFAIVGNAYQYQVQAADPDGDPLSYSVIATASGVTVDAMGLLTWTPGPQQLGDFTIEVMTDDGSGGTASQRFTVTADTHDNQLPQIGSTPPVLARAGVPYAYALQASDPRGGTLGYTLAAGPEGLVVDGAGNLSWLPGTADIGSYPVRIEVANSLGVRVQEYLLTVRGPNNAPAFTSQPVQTAKVGRAYRYAFTVQDADVDPLNYTLVSAPLGMILDAGAGELRWTPALPGDYSLILRADDGLAAVDQAWTLQVHPADTPLAADVVVTPAYALPGEAVTVTVTVIGNAGPAVVTGDIDGMPVTFDAAGQATVSATAPGPHSLNLTVRDDFDTVLTSGGFYVIDGTDTTAPQVALEAPLDGSEVTAPIDIIGRAEDANLVEYALYVAPAGSGNYTELTRGTASQPTGTVLGRFDPSLLPNGLYDILLQATDGGGQTTADRVTVRVTGNLKVGNFAFTVVDLEIPVSGIPIRVTRTYDSRRRHEALDFGPGWSVGYQDVKVAESRIPGSGWALNTYATGPLGLLQRYCVEPLGRPLVTVTLPDGRVETFEVRANPECSTGLPTLGVTLQFVPRPGTLSTLEETGGVLLRLSGGDLVDLGTGQSYDPDRYRLTTKEGFVYDLDQAFGIRSVKDPNGHTLTYSDSGILHSAGKSVLFTRDGLGRITAITDPNGKVYQYTYDTQGDLAAATDPLGQATRYAYDGAHGLTDILDPLDRPVVKNLYDTAGRLIAQEDGNGNRTDFSHDLAGRRSTVTDRLGRITTLAYDARGNVTSQIDALGHLTTTTYDADDNPLTRTDPLGNTTTATYDARRNQLTQTDANGNTVSFSYNLRGQELTIQDARGNRFENSYDSFGNLLTITDPLGNLAGQNIDAQGHVSLRRDALGNETRFTYDSTGNVLTETDALGNVTSYTYDANGNKLSETRTRTIDGLPTPETTTYSYDNLNRLIRTTYPDGRTTRIEYDAAGNESARIDALGRRTEYTYDAYRRLIQTTYPDGTTETNTYDAEGNRLSQTDRLGRITTYTYDALNRPIQVTYPDGRTTQTEYDAAGRITAEIDEHGNRTEYAYDAAGRRIQTTDALGNVTTDQYDPDGNLITTTDPLGQTTQYTVDALDRRIQTIHADGTTTQSAYDALGRLTARTDENGRTTRYEYDPLGRLTAVIDALNQRTEYTYDEAGNRLTQTDAKGHTTTWTYDAQGSVLSRTLPGGQTETFTVDAQGNQISHTDFNGNTTTYEYDLNDRLIRTLFPDGSQETITYDAAGNRTSVTTAQGTTTYTYDARDRLIQETLPDGTVLDYQYDAAGNRTVLLTTVNGVTEAVTYGYDGLNRLQNANDPQGAVTTYSYDANGNLQTLTYPNGNVTTYTYDARNRLTRQVTTDGSGTEITRYDTTLDTTGRRTQVTDHRGTTTTYTYDSLYRLVQADTTGHPTLGTYTHSYSYDAVGNRTSHTKDGLTTTYSYDANDRLIQAGLTTYGYDANGNRITKDDGTSQITYSYDSRNRLIQAITTMGGMTTKTLSYAYDTEGNRIEKTEDGLTTRYLIDRYRPYAQVLKALDSSNATLADYLYGLDLIKQSRSATDRYYLTDGLGSTRALTDNLGNITDTYDYSAYGNLIDSNGTTANDYLFTGEQYDPALSQYYLRARYYDPATGRFTAMDPFQGLETEPVTLHKYLYANADPVNTTDPTGLFGLVEFGVVNNIRVTLSEVQVDVGFSLINAKLDSESPTVAASGWGIIASLSPGILKPLSKTIKSKFIGRGKVAYNKRKLPGPEELEAAEFLAAKEGARIYIRGGGGAEGADFFVNGVKWELKTLRVSTDTAVSNRIRKGVNQSSRIIIDGRQAGLSAEIFYEGLARAQRNNAYPSQIKVILKDGSILDWP